VRRSRESRASRSALGETVCLAIGCDTALNLDGGGSSEIVSGNTLGNPYILNNPSGGTERYDAAALGVYALPLPGAHRSDDGSEEP
jgi:hypothetical protein